MIRFIDEYPNRFSVEFICQTLNIHREGGFITSRGYRQSKARGLSARRLRDAALMEHIRDVHADNYGVYGIRKMWHALRREGIDIGREQTARLMRIAGLSGKGKGGAAESDLLVGVLRNGGRAGFRLGGRAWQLALSGPAAGPLIRSTTRWCHVWRLAGVGACRSR
ncbi:IS3 family transposase [Corynebacterium hadale]|uniref:IS3 family transposase n=2 Tax=Corynebacterium hadale TaxID=2026255 RepID=UPI003B969146